MLVKNFHDLPQELQCEVVRPYFEILNQRRTSLFCKSIFDRVMAAGLLITLSPVFLILAIMIKRDSAGEVFFRQTRVTQYGRTFGIYKFRRKMICVSLRSEICFAAVASMNCLSLSISF